MSFKLVIFLHLSAVKDGIGMRYEREQKETVSKANAETCLRVWYIPKS